MNSICMRVFAVLLLAWLIAAAPVPQPAINTEAAPVTDGGLAAPAVGSGVGSANADAAASASRPRRVAFRPDLIDQGEGPVSDDLRLSKPKSVRAIRFPAGWTRPNVPESPSLPAVKYEGPRLKAPESGTRLNSGPASSDWEMSRLLENRPVDAKLSPEVAKMTSDLPEVIYGDYPKSIMTLSGNSELDSAALAQMTKDRNDFFVVNGKGRTWEFVKNHGEDSFAFKSQLGKSTIQKIESALAVRGTPLQDKLMFDLLREDPKRFDPATIDKMTNNLPNLYGQPIMTLSKDRDLNNAALGVMAERNRGFYVVDGKNVGRFWQNKWGPHYNTQVDDKEKILKLVEDSRPIVSQSRPVRSRLGTQVQRIKDALSTRFGSGTSAQASQDITQAAEASAAAASPERPPPPSEITAGAGQATSTSSVGTKRLPQDGMVVPASTEGQASAVAQPKPKFASYSEFPARMSPQRAQPDSWFGRTWFSNTKDPVQRLTTGMPKYRGVPILKYTADNQVRKDAYNEMFKNTHRFIGESADGQYRLHQQLPSGWAKPIRLGRVMQQGVREAVAPSWWSRVGQSTRTSLGRLSSYFHSV